MPPLTAIASNLPWVSSRKRPILDQWEFLILGKSIGNMETILLVRWCARVHKEVPEEVSKATAKVLTCPLRTLPVSTIIAPNMTQDIPHVPVPAGRRFTNPLFWKVNLGKETLSGFPAHIEKP